ncbi:oxygen-independent coproporphyrinogen III oxidase [Hasllibacter sp. MH4015]|uniref:oxygen-independent coproporphyrinogen III oxidase n=1 Tax=Hasllibacter sp. MH4015 TaxID=2854029 RepID=UPI001CD7D0B7|nr:oxygen-independent coproporphyrinogen III oxidase [Hasllibacter sp. MH4015]
MDQYSQLRRFGLFDANVPRYTSYPPASKFNDAVTPDIHRQWLGAIRPGAQVSIYLHIPFCRRLCWFCACRTQGTRSLSPVSAYVDTLIQEIATIRAALPDGVQAARIHWGGGTPTLLPPDDIVRLSDAVLTAFPTTSASEISVEIDPNEIDAPRLDALARMGMTRASIGVQDFDPEIQTIIGREQSYDVTLAAVEGIRARGIHSLNTDLLYGLPKQTRARIASSIQMLLSLNPDRIALYGYAHVPWMAKRQALIPTDDLPGPETRLRLFETAQETLAWDGYRQIGIDHFARSSDSLTQAAEQGRLRRNFQGYTDDICDVLIGLGASAISKFPQGFVQNQAATAKYQKAVRADALPTGRGHVFGGDDVLRARMIEMLMCDFHISVDGLVAERLGSAKRIRGILRRAADAFPGQVHYSADGLHVPDRAHPLARLIARQLDAYEIEPSGHSSAI